MSHLGILPILGDVGRAAVSFCPGTHIAWGNMRSCSVKLSYKSVLQDGNGRGGFDSPNLPASIG